MDLKHDLDSLVAFINTAKRTGKWDGKKLQLKTIPIDRIIGISYEEPYPSIPLHKEIQYRDERIQVLQAEIEQLRRTQAELSKQVEFFHHDNEEKIRYLFKTSNKHSTFASFLGDEDFKSQVDDFISISSSSSLTIGHSRMFF